MGKDKWAKVIDYLRKSKRDPDKVLKLLQKQEKGANKDSQYQVFRGSWAIAVIHAVYNKVGTPKDSRLKNTITNTIRNWCKSKDFEMEYAQWHPGKDNLLHEFSGPFHLDMYKKNLSLDKKIKMVKDIWYSKNYQYLKDMLSENNGKIPMSDPKIRKGLYINNKMVNEKDLKKYFPNAYKLSKNKK
tara:strand:- start:281 stop:838 length:558 start_codon:yes stop_codon:yes gene_type:complete